MRDERTLQWKLEAESRNTLQYSHTYPPPKLNTPLESDTFLKKNCMILHPTPHIGLFGNKNSKQIRSGTSKFDIFILIICHLYIIRITYSILSCHLTAQKVTLSLTQ